MKLTLKKELPFIGIVLMPFVYLAYLWNSLPEKVPTHWNYKGEIDHWGDKYSLITLVLLLPVLTYLLMLLIPIIDPKKRLALMGRKFSQIKFGLVLLMSIIALFIIYIAKNQSFASVNIIYSLIGVLLVFLGNYFKTIQPNYFLGIKTPWTLHNEEVWKLTHHLAGKMWVIGGFVILVSCLLLNETITFSILLSITAIITIVPIVYSYVKFKELTHEK